MSDEPPPSLVDRAADLLLYAPIGFALEAHRLLPDLAERGRRQLAFTRVVGKYAVNQGTEHLSGLMGRGDVTEAEAPVAEATPTVVADDPEPAPSPDPDHLAIPDYDSLSAFQVVPRLDGLDGAELDAVRAYEAATRGRRTILNKVAQIEASLGSA